MPGIMTALCIIAAAWLVAAPALAQQPGGPAACSPRAAYEVEAELDPGTGRLRAGGDVWYRNSSPDTLHQIYWHLYQNAFRAGSEAHALNQALGLSAPSTGGIAIRKLRVGGTDVEPEIRGTVMRTPLLNPLLPGDTLRFRVEWAYEVPGAEAPSLLTLRTGRFGDDFAVTQWYPQVAVYDQGGWDTTAYTGATEFYSDYARWSVRFSAPDSFVVAATGRLVNPGAVLSEEQQARLSQARAGSKTTIASPADGRSRPSGAGRTWHFDAACVRDFALAVSPDFVWEAARWNGRGGDVLLNLYYRPGEQQYRREGIAMTRDVLRFLEGHHGQYAYPQVTVVSGIIPPMEFPALVFAGHGGPGFYETLAHELAHQWYPMVVGTNETAYPFMDEGFATFLALLAVRGRYGEEAFEERLAASREAYLAVARSGKEVPVSVRPEEVPHDDFFRLTRVAWYVKPALILFMLREVLGEETFAEALQVFFKEWRYEHPGPEEFFEAVESVAGQDLGWFWEPWYGTAWTLDVAVEAVEQDRRPTGWAAAVRLGNRGRAKMPVTVRLMLADGTRTDVYVPVGAWEEGGERYTVRVEGLSAPVRSVEADPAKVLLDTDRTNNHWRRNASGG